MSGLEAIGFDVSELDHEEVAVTPNVSGLPLTELVESFERSYQYTPAGGYEGLVPSRFRYGTPRRHYLGKGYRVGGLTQLRMRRMGLLATSCQN